MSDEEGRPKFGDVVKSLSMSGPAAVSPDLWAALKAAQAGPSPSLRVCPYCSGQHAASMVCADDPMRRKLLGQHSSDRPQQKMCLGCRKLYTGDHECPTVAAPLPPLDPFTPGAEASAALAEMYSDMVEAGIPVASVESILGHMLAAYQLGKDQAE